METLQLNGGFSNLSFYVIDRAIREKFFWFFGTPSVKVFSKIALHIMEHILAGKILHELAR